MARYDDGGGETDSRTCLQDGTDIAVKLCEVGAS